MKIQVGTGFKSYKHQYKSSNNTSAGFGEVQPLMCRMMLPESSINVNLKQFVRLMPMPYPTVGQMQLKNIGKFVPIGDIFQPFDAFLSGLPYVDYNGVSTIVSSLPSVTNKELAQILMDGNYSVWSAWRLTNVTHSDTSIPNYDMFDDVTKYVDQIYSTILNSNVMADPITGRTDKHNMDSITVDGADYIAVCNAINTPIGGNESMSTTDVVYFTFKLNDAGKRLRKIFLGLGYNPCLEDETKVSALPLFAFYKAYYETFNPQRITTFQQTKTFSLIQSIQNDVNSYCNQSKTIFAAQAINDGDGESNYSLIKEWSDCFATENTDWVSLHTNNVYNDVTSNEVVPGDVTSSSTSVISNSFDTNTSAAKGVPSLHSSSQSQYAPAITKVQLNLLSRLTSIFTKDSLFGAKIQNWIENKFGADISNQIYAMCNNAGSSTTDIMIKDIYSQADTSDFATANSTGNVLGSFAGRGDGTGQGQFTFKTTKHGYFIILSYIEPQEGYFQGTDATLFALKNEEIPTPLYDALGYELTPRSAVWTDNGISASGFKKAQAAVDSSFEDSTFDGSSSFGYLPRYSGFKNIKNIVNGDLSRRGVISDMECFYMDKMLINRYVENIGSDQNHHLTYRAAQNNIPVASEQWRYIMRYPWLQNYNRIFYNFDDKSTHLAGSPLILDDNFMVHTFFDVTENNYLKPIRQSFDTFVEDVNTGSKDVQSV